MDRIESPLAKALEPLLERIFNTVIDAQGPHNFSDKAFFDATYLFNAVAGDVMYQLMDKEGIDRETRLDMAEKFGKEIRHLIKVYTGKDMHQIAQELIKDASDRIKEMKHEEEMKKRGL